MELVGRGARPGLVPVRIVGASRRTLPAARASLLVIACLAEARVRVGTGGFAVPGREMRRLHVEVEGMGRLLRALL